MSSYLSDNGSNVSPFHADGLRFDSVDPPGSGAQSFNIDSSQSKQVKSNQHHESSGLMSCLSSTCIQNNRLLFCIPLDWIFIPDDGHDISIRNSNIATLFLLLNTMIGSGIIVQGYVFAQSGILAALFEYVVISIMIYTGVEMIVRCAQHTDIFDYAELVRNIFPQYYGGVVIDFCIVLSNAGALLSYILVIGSLMDDIVGGFSNCTADDDHGMNGAWYCNIGWLTVLPIVFFTVPLCLIRKFGHLAMISYFSIAVISAIVFLVLIGGPIRRTDYPDDDTGDSKHVNLGSFLGSIKTIGDIVFALGYVTATFHSYNAMETKTVKNFSNVALQTTIIGACMCFLVGIVGYLSFRNNTQTNILLNFPGVIGCIFKIALVIHLILYIPGDFVILRAALWKLFDTDVDKQSNTAFVSVTLASILTITFIAIMLQLYSNANNLGLVVDITGGIAGSVLYFIAPGLSAMTLFPDDKFVYYRSMTLLVFGVCIVALVIAGSAM